MSAQDIRDRYKVPAALNMRIRVKDRVGTIAGFEGPRLLVMLDGEKSLTKVHPVLGVTYPAKGQIFPREPKRLHPQGPHLTLVPDDTSEPAEPSEASERKKERDEKFRNNPEDPLHGTVPGYRRHNCKCVRCKKAWAERCQAYKKSRVNDRLNPDDPRHGTQNFYKNFDCRCSRCEDAMSVSDLRGSHNKLLPEDEISELAS